MGLREWLYNELGNDFQVPGAKVYDSDPRFQKWVNGMTHEKWVGYRNSMPTYTTCMDFLSGVHNRITTAGHYTARQTFKPGILNTRLGYRTFATCEIDDFPQNGDFYFCAIPGGHHVGVFLELYEGGSCFTICGGADDANGGAICMGAKWPDGFLGWLNIDEFYY